MDENCLENDNFDKDISEEDNEEANKIINDNIPILDMLIMCGVL